jgi:gamma-glutamylcyclotransferase (GGCT)/AIG2-like uncharacterized protein YtfP
MKRVDFFLRNGRLESFLKEINDDLWNTEYKLLEKNLIKYPIIFVIGSLRSGSTLMMQWLANTGEFGYPTNMLSRFYNAPIIGAKIQQLLTDEKYNFRNEILDFNSDIDFTSENGKTKGAVAPNEFWYFWRRFLPFKDLDYLPDKELFEKVDINTFKQELLGIANVFEKPFALKGMICNYNIGFLDKVFDNALFIYTKRDPLTNIESALKARERQFGSVNEWYSFKIPEYPELIEYDSAEKQVAGQVYYINKAVEAGLSKVAEVKKVIVDYEKFCDNPKEFYKQIQEKLSRQKFDISKEYIGEESFNITRSECKDSNIIDAYNYFVERDKH